MFKCVLNMFKSNANVPQESRQMSAIILEQQVQIKTLLEKVRVLELDIEERPCMNEIYSLLHLQQIQLNQIKNSVNIDVKLNQYKNEFYENCINQGLSKSEWNWHITCLCAKNCESVNTCQQCQLSIKCLEAEYLELIEQIANKIMLHANKHMKMRLQMYKDDLVRNSSQSAFPIDRLSEKHLSEHNPMMNQWYSIVKNENERIACGNSTEKMKSVVPIKREKIIKLIIQLIDNILTLYL